MLSKLLTVSVLSLGLAGGALAQTTVQTPNDLSQSTGESAPMMDRNTGTMPMVDPTTTQSTIPSGSMTTPKVPCSETPAGTPNGTSNSADRPACQ